MKELEDENNCLIETQMAAYSQKETQDEISLKILELQSELNTERATLRNKLSSLAVKISGKASMVRMNP